MASGVSLAGFSLERRGFDSLVGWSDDDPRELIAALRRCRQYILNKKPYRTGALGIRAEELLPAMDAAEAVVEISSAAAARSFFETHFVPFFIRREDGASGFVTAFYEPDVEVSDTPDAVWRFPFYRRPEDLIDLDDANRPSSMDANYMFGQIRDGEISEYPDRRAIDLGHLEGQGLEIGWARSKADVFFAHVQGAARLIFRDGTVRRITYAAKAGHPFTGIGRHLVDAGEIDPSKISMGAIRDWLERNPDRADETYWRNRSYIFFREEEMGDPALGPIAAAKVQMTPGRSLAVDRGIHTFGCPFFIQSESLTRLDDGQPFRRLMLALDTGSAILGPARGDIFTGSGSEAGDLAGSVRNDANFFILVPRAAAERY
ncbi:MAG TPA: murein transglycosylase A [Ensifer sp.]|nr:murein transglycosylase A [Ensifer sp.]